MNFSEVFIRRPIATSLLMLAIALFGVVSYRALPVADLPSVDFPTLSVNASLPGADPATMSSAVATPLERQFTGIAGLDEDKLIAQQLPACSGLDELGLFEIIHPIEIGGNKYIRRGALLDHDGRPLEASPICGGLGGLTPDHLFRSG